MPARLSYDVDGLPKVEHRLLGMAQRALEPTPILKGFQDLLEREAEERFESDGDGEWEPLSPVTIDKKGSDIIGRDTDAMMASLTDEGAEGALREIIGDELIFGTNLTNEEGVYYPGIFDQGRRSGRQPARPLFDPARLNLRTFTKAVQAYLVAVDRAEFGANMGGDRIMGSDAMPNFEVLS